MNNSEKLKLIEGSFSYEEAREVLMELFSAKINFHEMRNFSSRERFGKEDENSIKRIALLKESTKKLAKFLEHAKSGQKKLIINSHIDLILADEDSVEVPR
ncbi:MAG TPA: hypothetical protein VLA71_19985 [Algoriphagus sp.]|nr:hypothetical protein [Algoriphagus sp.]